MAWSCKTFFATYGEQTPLPIAPDICIEILSPSNSKVEMAEKIDLYLAKGAREVWVCGEQGTLEFHAYRGQLEQSRLFPGMPMNIDT